MKKISISSASVLMAVLALPLISSCASASRAVASATGHPDAEASSGVVWFVEPPMLDPPAESAPKIYIRSRDLVGVDGVDMEKALTSAALERGWTLTRDPNEADMRVRVDLLQFDETEVIAQSLGSLPGILGAAAGVGVGVTVANATDSGLIGFGAGVVTGGIVDSALRNGMKTREWMVLADILVEGRQDTPITIAVNGSSAKSGGVQSAAATSHQVHGGSSTTSNERSFQTEVETYYLPMGTRVGFWAKRVGMAKEEAEPLISKKIERVFREVMP
jgi:hypothetical protein